MKKLGRPEIQLTQADIDELNSFIDNLHFLNKQQERYKQISLNTQFNDDEKKLIKSNLREMKAHQKRMDTFKNIDFKSSTNQTLTNLEAEILAYDWSIRDDFFNLQKALNTYIKLEKITHNEIKRIDQKERQKRINTVRSQQTESQKQRTAENRRKYFIGASLLGLKDLMDKQEMGDIDFLQYLALSTSLWSGADQAFSLSDAKYMRSITKFVGNQTQDIIDFIQQVKEDKRQ